MIDLSKFNSLFALTATSTPKPSAERFSKSNAGATMWSAPIAVVLNAWNVRTENTVATDAEATSPYW